MVDKINKLNENKQTYKAFKPLSLPLLNKGPNLFKPVLETNFVFKGKKTAPIKFFLKFPNFLPQQNKLNRTNQKTTLYVMRIT